MELSFDSYLTERVGWGKSQCISFMVLSMIELMEGFLEVFQAILIRILKTQWSITENEQAMLGGLFFAGNMFGNIICSFTADIFGRKVMLILSQTLSILMMLINSLSIYYYQVAITIFFYGLLFGISMPISQVMVSEIFPVKVRGIFIVLLQFIYILGILYLILMCGVYLDSFDSGDWGGLLLVNIAPAVACLFGSVFFLTESPRLLIYNEQYEQGFKLLDSMGLSNNKQYQPITSEEKTAIMKWRQKQSNSTIQIKDVFYGLFRLRNLKITSYLWIMFILFNIVSCGITIITPYLYDDADNGFIDMFMAYSCEIPGIIFVALLFENRKWGGRIKCTIYGLFIMTGIQVTLFYQKENFLIVGLMFIRFGCRVVWSCLNALPAESYNTALRSMGVGAAQGVGKMAGASASFITLPLYYYSDYLPFLCGGILCLLGCALMMLYPVNATQKALDIRRKSSVQVEEESHDSIEQSFIGGQEENCK